MSSNGGGIGSTLTGRIQDVAAILPLLGTEQCSVQVSSALTRGYLYAAAAPMSIFGSLGVVIAGFKTLVACLTLGNIEGAKILGNIGFEPQGENLSLIIVEPGKGKTAGRYIIETRMDDLITELNIDRTRITGVSHKSASWNLKMMASTALLCAFGIAPYIFLNQGANSLDKSTRWIFPVVRVTGGFITATLIQLLIQQRITSLADQYLVERDQLPVLNADVEPAIEPDDTKKRQVDARTWLLICFLLIGLVASIVGYVGCFSVVQNSMTNSGPVSWFCLEAGLSLVRLAIWAYNSTSDDAPPLEIMIELDKYEHKPLPTCNKDNYDILQYKVLPLTRASDFLKIITSFAGLIEPFGNLDLSLYYTLTRKRSSEENVPTDIEIVHRDGDKLGERTLYITVFDHRERTTRVYTRDNEKDIFYSTRSAAPHVDVGHFLLEVEIDAKIDAKGDPVSSDSNNLDSLRKHHQSILEHIQYRLGLGAANITSTIENSWTMKVEDTISSLQKLKEDGNGDVWRTVVENGKKLERTEESSLICDYFMHSSIERDRRLLDEKRGKWIARRMEMITEETKERFLGMEAEYRVNMKAVEKKATKSPKEIERWLFEERYMMELLLVYEVNEWEQLFWNKFKAFLDQIGNDRAEWKEILTREWRADCWKRLSPQMHAVKKRLANDNNRHLKILGKWWASSISQFFEGVQVENTNLISLFKLREEIKPPNEEMRLRMENEIEDIEFRLKRGSELRRFDQFWDDNLLFRCRYSRSKWLNLDLNFSSAPLEILSHALKRNKNIIYIHFGHHDSDSHVQATICDLPWVTSISRGSSGPPPAIPRDTLFIKSTNNDLITFAKDTQPKMDSISTYIFTDADGSDLYRDKLGNNARILISFVAPTSGQTLTLRLKHSGVEDGRLVVTLGSTAIQLNPSSLTIHDITLHPIPGPGHLSFVPGRNDIVVQFTVKRLGLGHLLHDIELLDEASLKDPRNQIITGDRAR